MTNNIDDLRNRIVGNRYYDQEADESFTVVGLSSHDGKPVLAFFQYDDGVVWDELATPEMLSPERAENLRVEEGGIDSERYVPLGPGPTLGESDRLCPSGEHDWTPLPQEIWPDGVPDGSPDTLAPSDLYNRIARCKRCGPSGEVVSQLKSHATPWFCAHCGDVWEELSYAVDGWEDTPICEECRHDLRSSD